ncbi:Trp biosynthesis-associated membrane protein [Micromonospora sp. WMMD812]|uniref:Trp biosynthesis-associated membrane protein n=1 Tax=Micromonospora sp. WMMD812 TaxID=3015152 RepID=UPI00248C9731|nr:Trp biosynthesis-associated membrane protein [Micromonospora sp. WMMD812]WBB67322.1 Trp biosynthesis-associated membrane protein [Micromonospora sp. WMMD812]
MSARAGTGRRELTYAVLLSLAGAGLAFWAATRTWSVELTVRPTPLAPERADHTGGGLLPWLPALAVVGLAGAGAVLATRGWLRQLVGGLLALLGVAVAAGGLYGLMADFAGAVSRQWPALCLVGGLVAAGGGLLTALRGRGWPGMGARYERPARVAPAAGAVGGGAAGGGAATGGDVAGGAAPGPVAGRRTTEAWDALDRGEDPTVS